MVSSFCEPCFPHELLPVWTVPGPSCGATRLESGSPSEPSHDTASLQQQAASSTSSEVCAPSGVSRGSPFPLTCWQKGLCFSGNSQNRKHRLLVNFLSVLPSCRDCSSSGPVLPLRPSSYSMSPEVSLHLGTAFVAIPTALITRKE